MIGDCWGLWTCVLIIELSTLHSVLLRDTVEREGFTNLLLQSFPPRMFCHIWYGTSCQCHFSLRLRGTLYYHKSKLRKRNVFALVWF